MNQHALRMQYKLKERHKKSFNQKSIENTKRQLIAIYGRKLSNWFVDGGFEVFQLAFRATEHSAGSLLRLLARLLVVVSAYKATRRLVTIGVIGSLSGVYLYDSRC